MSPIAGRGWQEGRDNVVSRCSDKAWALGRYQVPACPARGHPPSGRGQKNKNEEEKRIAIIKNNHYFCNLSMENGRMAEWLGRGLQNLLQRFESASDLVY